jgi:hypothetical protein
MCVASALRSDGGGKLGTLGPNYLSVAMSSQLSQDAKLTFRSTPSSLPDIKATPNRPRIRLPTLCIHKTLLRFNNRPGLPFIVHTQYLTPDFKGPPLARHRQRLEELDFALAIQHTLGVELGHASDGRRIAARVEVYDFLICVLER